MDVLLAYSYPCVTHLYNKSLIVLLDLYSDSSFESKLRRIPYQIEEDLLQPLLVGLYGLRNWDIHDCVQIEAFLRHLEMHDLTNFIDCYSDVKFGRVDLKFTIFYTTEIQGIFYNVLKVQGGVIDNL